MTEKRKQYSKEFKLDAIGLVLDQGLSRKDAAASLNINAQMLGRCIMEPRDEDGQAFRRQGKLTPKQEETKKLKAQIKELEQGRDKLPSDHPPVVVELKPW